MTLDYPTASARQLAAALAAREVSAAELAETAIARIEALDGAINAVPVRDFARARTAAKAADAALARGERAPLLGVPVTVKESFFTPGLPTTWGFEASRGWTPSFEATAVTRLKAAGAVLIGKTNVPVALADWQSDNPIYGRTNNPRDLALSPGGSSGGSAASLAAGYVPLELGSDIGGSVRIPAHFCGVFGHKPTHGLIPLTGHAPPGVAEPGAGVDMAVAGPLARTAADLDLALSILAGPDGENAKAYRADLPPPRHTAPQGARILVLDRHPNAPVDEAVLGVLHAAAERLGRAGAAIVHAHPRLPDLEAEHDAYIAMLMTIITRQPGSTAQLDAHAWMNALDRQARARHAWAAVFDDVDAILAPPIGMAAFPHDDSAYDSRTLILNGAPSPYGPQIAWPGIANYAGLPSTCAPAGQTPEGLPVGVQIIGPWLEDRTTIALAGMIAPGAAWIARRAGG
jgi:amidase